MSAIFGSSDQIKQWKYKVKELNILIPGSSEPVEIENSALIKLDIESNYEEYYFPLIKVTLVLKASVYYKILEHKNKCKFHIRIDRYYKTPNKETESLSKTYLNKTFTLIMDDNTEDMGNALKDEENKSDYKRRKQDEINSLEAHKIDNGLEFYLFNDTIDGTRNNTNKVLSNANVTDAITYLATVGKLNNLLMPPADNTTRYPFLLIPPQTVIKNFAFLDSYYGIFKTGSIIFFDVDYTYIIPYSGTCDVWYPGEIKETCIIVPTSANTDHPRVFGSLDKKDNKNYIIADASTLSISNRSISNNYLNSNSAQVVDSYANKDTTSTSTAKSKNGNFTKIFEDKTENPFIAEMYSAQSNAKSDVISLRLQDYDISAISPNKAFNVIFEDNKYTAKYNGSYILAGVSHSFLTEGTGLLLNSTIVLRKV